MPKPYRISYKTRRLVEEYIDVISRRSETPYSSVIWGDLCKHLVKEGYTLIRKGDMYLITGHRSRIEATFILEWDTQIDGRLCAFTPKHLEIMRPPSGYLHPDDLDLSSNLAYVVQDALLAYLVRRHVPSTIAR